MCITKIACMISSPRFFFRRVILSSDPSLDPGGYLAVAIFAGGRPLLFSRAGEQNWSLLDEADWLEDVMFHEGKLMGVARQGYIVAIDLSTKPPKKTIVSESYRASNTSRYLLVDSPGDLLQVCRDAVYIEGEDIHKVGTIRIARLDPQQGTWSPFKSLGQQSLFIGNCYSMCLSAHGIPGFKLNCVCFTDGAFKIFNEEVLEMLRDAGVYNLEDGSVENFNRPDDFWIIWPPPVFITPTGRQH